MYRIRCVGKLLSKIGIATYGSPQEELTPAFKNCAEDFKNNLNSTNWQKIWYYFNLNLRCKWENWHSKIEWGKSRVVFEYKFKQLSWLCMWKWNELVRCNVKMCSYHKSIVQLPYFVHSEVQNKIKSSNFLTSVTVITVLKIIMQIVQKRSLQIWEVSNTNILA